MNKKINKKNINLNNIIYFLKFKLSYMYIYGDWGLGIGDWGLGPIPNPQSPIPNPQSPIPIYNFSSNIIVHLKI